MMVAAACTHPNLAQPWTTMQSASCMPFNQTASKARFTLLDLCLTHDKLLVFMSGSH